jgi:tetratricopeptide (TPR) repeat protein
LVLFILQSVEKMTKGRSFGAGIFLGICSFVQGNMMLFGLAFPVWAVWRSGDDLRRGIVSGIVFCAGFALVAGAAAGANYLSDRNVVFFSRNAGLNVFLGNNPEANGIFHCPSYLTATQEGMYRDARITAQMAAGRELRVSEISRFWLRRSFAFMREQPRIFLRLLARKFLLLFTPREFFSDPEFKYVASSVRILKILFLDLRFILPLAIAGMVLAARRFRDCFLLYAATGAVLANIPVFYFQTKLRIGAVPFLAVFAGYALYAVGKMFREKKIVPGVLLAAGITALGFFLVRPVPGEKRSVPSGAFDEYRSHFDTAMYYETRGDYVRALEELKRARAVRTDSHLLFCLGAVSYQLKDFRGAEEYFHQTIQAFPLYIDAYYNLGFLLNEEGRFEEAAGILRTAVSFDPDDTGVRFELARACEGRKDYACARIHLREALARGTALSPAEKDLVARKLAALP